MVFFKIYSLFLIKTYFTLNEKINIQSQIDTNIEVKTYIPMNKHKIILSEKSGCATLSKKVLNQGNEIFHLATPHNSVVCMLYLFFLNRFLNRFLNILFLK